MESQKKEIKKYSGQKIIFFVVSKEQEKKIKAISQKQKQFQQL